MRVVWQCENDEFASRVLRKHWPHLTNYGDVTQVDWKAAVRPDVLAGGFMCTDVSVAGKRAGTGEGTRSGVTWREYARAISQLRPRYVLVENVSNLLAGNGGMWFGAVLGALASCGYDVEWDHLPASAFGAPHIRDRVFLVGKHRDGGLSPEPVFPRVLAHTRRKQLGWLQLQPARSAPSDMVQSGPSLARPAPPRGSRRQYRDRDGLPRWVDERAMKGLGNAVCPAVAEQVGRWISAHALKGERIAA
jgi:DNA (cytosine-5)-methyltransferase 1